MRQHGLCCLNSMKTIFKKGTIVFEEGSRGSEAYLISSGKVRVFRTKNGLKVPLAVLGQNQIFGEMGMIDERPRSASVEALEDTEAVVVGPDDFAALSSSDPELFMFILKTIFERLRNVNQRVLDLSMALPRENYMEGKVFISGLTPEASAVLDGAELELKKFPFKVGRKTVNFMKDVFSHNDLYIQDKEPFSVSKNHFAIESRATGFFVVDRGSAAGTTVNGILIGGASEKSETELNKGENLLTAGAEGSKFKFKVELR